MNILQLFLLRLWLKSFICAEWHEVAPLGSSAPDCSGVNELWVWLGASGTGMWTDLTLTLLSSGWMHCSPPFNDYTAHKSKKWKVILCPINKLFLFHSEWMLLGNTPNIEIHANTDHENHVFYIMVNNWYDNLYDHFLFKSFILKLITE